VVGVKFFKLFSCPSNTESLLLVGNSSSWYPTAQAVGPVAVFQVVQSMLPETLLLVITSFWIIIMLKKAHCLPSVPDQPLLLLCFNCGLQKMFLRPLPFHLTASSANQKKIKCYKNRSVRPLFISLMFSVSDLSQIPGICQLEWQLQDFHFHSGWYKHY